MVVVVNISTGDKSEFCWHVLLSLLAVGKV